MLTLCPHAGCENQATVTMCHDCPVHCALGTWQNQPLFCHAGTTEQAYAHPLPQARDQDGGVALTAPKAVSHGQTVFKTGGAAEN